MDAYFNENRVIGRSPVSNNDWEKRLEGMRIRSNIKKEIRLLTGYDRDMQRAITMDSEYTKEVTFCYLEMIGIKRGKRERGRYKALIDVLKTMGINLVIA
ncbi:hypothetical protein [Bacteroides uniformis]|uniref:hypothetical protein n=1 Tax=Bacteroides uniformis TaxID=820 RepID=UPI003F1F3744